DVMRLLETGGASVSFHDPYIAKIVEDGHTVEGVPLSAKTLNETDAVVIITDHRNVDYQFVMDHASLIVDSRNITAGLVQTKAQVVTLAAARMPADAMASAPRGA